MTVKALVNGSVTEFTSVTKVEPIVNGTKLLITGTEENIIKISDLIEITDTP